MIGVPVMSGVARIVRCPWTGAASTVLLLIAGTLEGFVSPIETWPLGWKLAVSGATAVFLAVYLLGGRPRVSPSPASVEGGATGEMLGLGARS